MSKSMVRRKHVQQPPQSPSEIVKAYIRFDEYQQHLHSWHTLQDCLEALRLWERDNAERVAELEAALTAMLTVHSLSGVHEIARAALKGGRDEA